MRQFHHAPLAGLVLSIIVALSGGLTGGLTVSAQPPQQRSLDSTPERMSVMDHHFSTVGVLHTALIRGDLSGVRAPAQALSAMRVPPEVPAAATFHVEAIRAAARKAADATAIGDAASATALMLQQCGECHRQVGVFPPVRVDTFESSAGVSAHMREHKRGLDEMLNGLVVPSNRQWLEGAERLGEVALEQDKLPSARTPDGDNRDAETRVHEIAARAAQADAADRPGLYAELVTTCASCHALKKDWGPR